MTHTIKDIKGRVVYDSRGDKTVEVEVNIDGQVGQAAAPSGKSRGAREAEPFPTGGPEAALETLRREIAPKLVGMAVENYETIDKILAELDGTWNFSRIGGNTALAISIATAIAISKVKSLPLYAYLATTTKNEPALPLPLGNVIGGGKHAGPGAPEIQEFLVIPRNPNTINDAVMANIKVHKIVGRLLEGKISNYPLGKGDEGAYAPPISVEAALEILYNAAKKVEDELNVKMSIGIDVAGTNIYNPHSDKYILTSAGLYLDNEGFLQYLAELADKYEIIYIEDPFREDDYESFRNLSRALPRTYVCGDDLVVTRAELISKAASIGAIRAAIIKPNQVGTLSLTWDAVRTGKDHNLLLIASHRSGETTDHYLPHIAVGFGCKVIKAGIMGGERIAKANELIRLGEQINKVQRLMSS